MKFTRQNYKAANAVLQKLQKENGSCYFVEFPFDKLHEELRKNGFELFQEDGTSFEGFFCGRNGKSIINIGIDEPAENSCLVFNWYTMPSGNYEITWYVS